MTPGKSTSDYTKIHPFNVHPNFSRVLSDFFLGQVASARFFKVVSLKKDGFHCKSEKNHVSTLKNQGVAAPQKNKGAPYENLGRFQITSQGAD